MAKKLQHHRQSFPELTDNEQQSCFKMYERIQTLCKQKGTTITKLCILITGSSGNLNTWKKGYMRTDYLKKIANYFNVSTDYLLAGEQQEGSLPKQTGNELMFWERFYNLCTSKKIKPNAFAKIVGISSGVITKWKQGSLPNTEALMKISNFFDVSIDYLLTGKEKSLLHDLTENEQQILDIFKRLTGLQQGQIICILFNEYKSQN